MRLFVGRIYYQDKEDLLVIGREFSFWEIDRINKFAVTSIRPDQFERLTAEGWRIEEDIEKTKLLHG